MISEVTELENTIQDQRKQVAVMEAFERLSQSEDWKTVIEDLYFVKEPQRISECMADPNLMVYRERFAERMTSIGDMKVFLRTLVQVGQDAVERIPETEALLERARMRADTPEEANSEWED